MNGKMKTRINFLAMFKTADGKQHWAVHSYDNISKSVNMLRDLVFENNKPVCYDKAPHGRFYVLSDDSSNFQVIDRIHDAVIAVFCNEADATDFCDTKNGQDLRNDLDEDYEA